jgi:hypothetical protein
MASFSLQAPSLSVLLLVGQMDSPPPFSHIGWRKSEDHG